MDGKVLTKETKKLVIAFLLSLFIKNIPWIFRKIVKAVVSFGVNFADKSADKVIPDNIDALINIAITKLNQGDMNAAGQATGTALGLLVEIQNVSGIKKRNAFVTGMQLLFDFIDGKIKNRK